jgi:hypothetical protein
VASVGGASAAESTPSPDRITRAAGAALRDTSSSVRAGADAPEGGAPGPRALGLPSRGRYAFLLELDASSTSRAQKAAPGAATSSAARAAGRTQLAAIRSAQSRVVAELPSRTPVLFRTHAVLAGVAVISDVRNLDALRVIPGVKAVHPIAPKTRSNSYAVPLQGAPSVWTGGGGVAGNTGQGTSLGIVDTGIDYTHANFGGPGTVAAYDRASKNGASTPNPALFGPGNRVVGGTDLAGDGYDADNPDDDPTLLPAPDDNPLDCEGHGSHVAGSAGGSGVRANGRTYAGAYTDQTPFSSLRIGPGMAPQADLYAIRVFGCAGSTNLVTQAYDYAVDPTVTATPPTTSTWSTCRSAPTSARRTTPTPSRRTRRPRPASSRRSPRATPATSTTWAARPARRPGPSRWPRPSTPRASSTRST